MALGLAPGLFASSCGSTSSAAPRADVKNVANDQAAAPAPEPLAVTLRAQGPDGLARALALYDAADSVDGVEKDELAHLVDTVAAQRYATSSRLYWYTDLEEAKRAATDSGRPILSLRMLGRLDEDLSCANSRLFRVVLYANESVSAFLRQRFVLHWSSERQVPRVTVDYGDGRVIETTIAGNSAHYVLDSRGRPVDVLPGLYGPQAFISALSDILPVAAKTDALGDRARMTILASHHAAASKKSEARLAGDPLGLSPTGRMPGTITLGAAEQLTVTKAFIERPMVRAVKLGAPLIEASSEASLTWELAARVKEPAVLDARSRALIEKLAPTDWAAAPTAVTGPALDQLIAALELRVNADTVLAELGLRYQIHRWFAAGEEGPSFEALNRRIYAEVFLTPASDPWLGIATPGVFSGLPSDGHRGSAAVAGLLTIPTAQAVQPARALVK